MMAEIVPQQEYKRARQAVDEFVARFDESYRLLAYHAALPLVLTPELLNYLRNQFLRGQVPWVAEVDLLLSDLCSPAGYELYTMDTAVRAYLLSEMRKHPELGPVRMGQVAHLLIHYVRHLAQTDPSLGKHELQAQQWAAMVYLDDKRETAVLEIAQAFRSSVVPAAVDTRIPSAMVDQAEMVRLSRLTQALAPGLEKHPELVEYAVHVGRLLIDPSGTEAQRLYLNGQLRRRTRIAGIELPTLEALVPYDIEDQVRRAVSRPDACRWALLVGVNQYADLGFPSLKYCINDVVALEQLLTSLGYVVTILHDDMSEKQMLPTRGNIERELTRICASMEQDSLLWVHFSCHGRQVDEQTFVITSEISESDWRRTALSQKEVERLALEGDARHMILTLDISNILGPHSQPEDEAALHDALLKVQKQKEQAVIRQTLAEMKQRLRDRTVLADQVALRQALDDAAIMRAEGVDDPELLRYVEEGQARYVEIAERTYLSFFRAASLEERVERVRELIADGVEWIEMEEEGRISTVVLLHRAREDYGNELRARVSQRQIDALTLQERHPHRAQEKLEQALEILDHARDRGLTDVDVDLVKQIRASLDGVRDRTKRWDEADRQVGNAMMADSAEERLKLLLSAKSSYPQYVAKDQKHIDDKVAEAAALVTTQACSRMQRRLDQARSLRAQRKFDEALDVCKEGQAISNTLITEAATEEVRALEAALYQEQARIHDDQQRLAELTELTDGTDEWHDG